MKSKIHVFNSLKLEAMSKKIIIGIALFTLGAGSAKVNAQRIYMPVIRHQQICEQKRIYNGVQTGELTPRELGRLEMQQAKIQHDKRCAKADGIISPYERTYIRIEETRASRNIYRQKHDGDCRF